MPESTNSGQGTITPTLFIGLGGVGSRIVDLIATRASYLPNWASQLSSLTSFISIDTNKLDQNRLAKIPNRIRIGAFDKVAIIDSYRASKNVQALQWLDRGYVPREGVTPGAGQIRVESRFGFFHHSPTIRSEFTRIVESMLMPANTWRKQGAQGEPGDFYVYLFATLAGGTGSGSFLSAAYLISDVIRSVGHWQPRVIGNLVLSTLMTQVVHSSLHPNIHANTYAALKELEHLTKLNYKLNEKQTDPEKQRKEKFAYWRDKNRADVMEVRSGPLFLSFIYDQPPNFTLDDTERAVADTCFLQIFTPVSGAMAGVLDNYQQHLQKLTQLPGDLSNVGLGYTTYFGAVGGSALVLPANDLLKYCALRFAAEALRAQITFGKTSEDTADDRARALAQLAVDYSDRRFLRMSDEGRNEAINQSFVSSVREMKRQDEREDLKDGFWYQLVESVDEGHPTTTEKGEVQRSESTLKGVKRKLGEVRQALLDKVVIRERAFSFHRESVNMYLEIVSMLEDDIRRGRVVVQDGMEGIKRSAREGEVVTDLKLDPIAERYLVLRLLAECQEKWIPEAQSQYDAAKARDISTPAVRERLQEQYQSLQQAAKRSLAEVIKRSDDAFYRVRDEAQDNYRSVATAARKLFDAEINLGQLRELLVYLQGRARQYAALAGHMNTLVADLERQAEELRQGQTGEARLALSVEVFETLEEPKQRLWDRVYRHLYVDEGRYLSTFDRSILARCIAEQLKPQIRADGLVEAKPTETIVSDLRKALVDLGENRLRVAIFGDAADQGLDLWRGLDLEARLVLTQGESEGQRLRADEIEMYRAKKFKALAQISGILGRVDTDTFQARNDGVTVGKSRYLVHGFGRDANNSLFLRQLESVLAEGGYQVNFEYWHDPRIVIVYDVVAPIALYYVRPVIGELQKAYQTLQADELRGFHLHTDYHWEETLPNLNPLESELEVDWAMNTLAQGLVAGVIEQLPKGDWVWHRKLSVTNEPSRKEVPLGETLAAMLYRIGEYHRSEDLRTALDTQIRQELEQMGADAKTNRRQRWQEVVRTAITDIGIRQQNGEITQEEFLDRPILRVLDKVLVPEEAATGAGAAHYHLRIG